MVILPMLLAQGVGLGVVSVRRSALCIRARKKHEVTSMSFIYC
jgi:hypothetical protein